MERKFSNKIITVAAVLGFVSTTVLVCSWIKWKNEIERQEKMSSTSYRKLQR